ncbi:hypothetical protein PUR28_18565 [Streptomyces sp. BE308]|uniref:hypothetical protein n=1 Tax=Streptomyces sp. BE308 TaxID=3002529 RepID=UPI002E79107D|nr:hypothetical protein [Streptomyces sp. BE308]MEE1792741.1 hypothetical protein [Streptomyces sp. BE308]
MSEFIKQLPALLGVVIGALGSYVVVMRGDRARFRREDEARWQERRLAAYSDYALSLKKTVTLNRRVAAFFLGHDSHPQALPPADAAPLLVDATDARLPSGEGLLMLGSPEVVEAAHGRALTVMEVELLLRASACSADAWSAQLEKQREAREKYCTAVRRDMELPPGHSGRWHLPPTRLS